MFKIGEKVICHKSDGNWYKEGDVQIVSSEGFRAYDSYTNDHYTAFNVEEYKEKRIWIDGRDFTSLSNVIKEPNYAAAFNMWQDSFINNPQAYEDSQTIAIRHLTEKLNGEEPSYGMVAEQTLMEYLNKLESK